MAAPAVTYLGASNRSDSVANETITGASWNAGDRIIVVGLTGDNGTVTFTGTPAATGLTFTTLGAPFPTNVTNTCKAYAWDAVAASNGSGDITITGGASIKALFAWKAVTSGIGAKAATAGGSGTTVSLARTGANSAVIGLLADWNATNDTTVTASPAGGTQRDATYVNGSWTVFAFDWGDQGASGTTSYGISGFASNAITKVAIEVLGVTAPSNSVAPAVTGTPTEGETLTCTDGTWTGMSSVAKQWRRDTGSGYTNISGATAGTYDLTSDDVGAMVRCRVTATGPGGTTSADSNEVGPVTAAESAPVNTVTPSVTPTYYTVGDELTCDGGTWTGEPEPDLAYQWYGGLAAAYENDVPLFYELLDGETAATITTSETHYAAGGSYFCVVTALNDAGTEEALSNQASKKVPPVNTAAPEITPGTADVGDELACSTGTWNSWETPSYAYQWHRDFTPIPDATSSGYTLQPEDAGATIDCGVIASNSTGASEEAVTSNQITVPAQAGAWEPYSVTVRSEFDVLEPEPEPDWAAYSLVIRSEFLVEEPDEPEAPWEPYSLAVRSEFDVLTYDPGDWSPYTLTIRSEFDIQAVGGQTVIRWLDGQWLAMPRRRWLNGAWVPPHD